jgi:hypothetical protein
MTPQTLDRPHTKTAYQISRADLMPGAILSLSNADHIRCEVKYVDDHDVTLTVMDNQLIDGKPEMTLPINQLTERGWRLASPAKSVWIDPSDIRPGAILGSPVENIRCRVDSVEHGRAKLSVLDNNTLNGDKEVTVAVDRDLLTGWHLLKKAA